QDLCARAAACVRALDASGADLAGACTGFVRGSDRVRTKRGCANWAAAARFGEAAVESRRLGRWSSRRAICSMAVSRMIPMLCGRDKDGVSRGTPPIRVLGRYRLREGRTRADEPRVLRGTGRPAI